MGGHGQGNSASTGHAYFFLQGWVEMQKENNPSDAIYTEMEKDVNRLKLVSDRFGKIGSTPQLEETNIVEQI